MLLHGNIKKIERGFKVIVGINDHHLRIFALNIKISNLR